MESSSYIVSRSALARYILLSILIILTIIGIVTFRRLPLAQILELAIFLWLLLFCSRISKPAFPIAFFSVVYILISLLFALLVTNTHVADFFIAYKAFIYLPILAFFVGKSSFERVHIKHLLHFLLAAFFIKYFYTVALSINERPDLFAENNFELLFLSLVFYLKYIKYRSVSVVEVLLLISIFALSGSRSGVLMLFFLLIMIYSDRLTYTRLIYLLSIAFIILPLIIIILLLRLDSAGFAGIDRILFAGVFLQETSNWNYLNILFGTLPLTPLSEGSCSTLASYERLFSYSGDGSCYSVILHSYILRALFDHGILIFILLLYSYVKFIRLSGYSNRETFTVIGILLINSLSVSSFNSVFSVLAISLYLFARRQKIKSPNKNR